MGLFKRYRCGQGQLILYDRADIEKRLYEKDDKVASKQIDKRTYRYERQ